MAIHELRQTIGADMESRFLKDSKRISRAEFQRLMDKAYQTGQLDCVWTRGKQLSGGRIRRTNGLTIRI